MKKDVCGSREQCMGPINSAISDQCVDVQSASGSRAKYTRPTGRSVPHVKPTTSIKKKKKKLRKREKVDVNKPNPNRIKVYVWIVFCVSSVSPPFFLEAPYHVSFVCQWVSYIVHKIHYLFDRKIYTKMFSKSHVLFTDLQTSFFTKTVIKSGSHSTIHTFKNYFAKH